MIGVIYHDEVDRREGYAITDRPDGSGIHIQRDDGRIPRRSADMASTGKVANHVLKNNHPAFTFSEEQQRVVHGACTNQCADLRKCVGMATAAGDTSYHSATQAKMNWVGIDVLVDGNRELRQVCDERDQLRGYAIRAQAEIQRLQNRVMHTEAMVGNLQAELARNSGLSELHERLNRIEQQTTSTKRTFEPGSRSDGSFTMIEYDE